MAMAGSVFMDIYWHNFPYIYGYSYRIGCSLDSASEQTRPSDAQKRYVERGVLDVWLTIKSEHGTFFERNLAEDGTASG